VAISQSIVMTPRPVGEVLTVEETAHTPACARQCIPSRAGPGTSLCEDSSTPSPDHGSHEPPNRGAEQQPPQGARLLECQVQPEQSEGSGTRCSAPRFSPNKARAERGA